MKTILFSILILFSINGFAYNWKKVIDGVLGDSFYVDGDSIKKHNGYVYYWLLSDYLEPLTTGANSAISKFKVDCGEEKVTWLTSTHYSQSMGKGKILRVSSPNTVEYPKPKLVGYIVMQSVCEYVKKEMIVS